MARGDGIHRTSARNAKLADGDIGKIQGHNEREKELYSNQDIVPMQIAVNENGDIIRNRRIAGGSSKGNRKTG